MAQIAVKGRVLDLESLAPVPFSTVTVRDQQTTRTVSADANGVFEVQVESFPITLLTSSVGFDPDEVTLTDQNEDMVNLYLMAANAIEEVVVRPKRRRRYSNKNNPAVELIRQVVAHKAENRLSGQNYAEYNQYEKVMLGLSNLDEKFKNRKLFKSFQFLFQEDDSVKDGSKKYILPAFMEEKSSKVYYRKDPNTTKAYVLAEKRSEFDDRFIDNSGMSMYFNKLYDKIDIYDNNVTLLTNQFLSPIATSAPNFYRFYITDTVSMDGDRFVELSFVPRNKNDMLFKGQLYITLDGRYAVRAAKLYLDEDANVNFVRTLRAHLDFSRDNASGYFLAKSDLEIDFALSERGRGIRGRRELIVSNYLNNIARHDSVYRAKEEVPLFASNGIAPNELNLDVLRPEPLTAKEAAVYSNVAGLQSMKSFQRFMDISSLFLMGYKQVGPVEVGPVNTFYSYNPVEGIRFRFGGRTTERFSERVYLEGYGAYGLEDQQWKYFLSGTYSLNKRSPYKFPQHYIRASASRDTKIPGMDLEFVQEDNVLLSFKRGENRSFTYNNQYKLDYKAEFEGNFAVGAGVMVWKQTAAGVLQFIPVNGNPVTDAIGALNTTEVNVNFRYAPHEEFYQGKNYRTPIVNGYPVFTFNYSAGLKDVLAGEYNYHRFSMNISKRLYLSQLGYADIDLNGTYIAGSNLPFPLLTLHRANQSYAYQLNSYNLMNFLEFVSDHHVAANVQYYMNGFLFNKIPLLNRLKLREVFSYKMVYGGLRDTNNPSRTDQVYAWQTNAQGEQSSYTFDANTPYSEMSLGVANIFKFLRVDYVRRLNYLNHPTVSPWGIRARFKFDF